MDQGKLRTSIFLYLQVINLSSVMTSVTGRVVHTNGLPMHRTSPREPTVHQLRREQLELGTQLVVVLGSSIQTPMASQVVPAHTAAAEVVLVVDPEMVSGAMESTFLALPTLELSVNCLVFPTTHQKYRAASTSRTTMTSLLKHPATTFQNLSFNSPTPPSMIISCQTSN